MYLVYEINCENCQISQIKPIPLKSETEALPSLNDFESDSHETRYKFKYQ